MLGEITKGKVTDENEEAYYVQVDGVTFELKKIEVTQDEPIKLGDTIQGFIYENKDKKREMTQFYPFAQRDQYGWGTVTEVRRDLGVFVDIGLNDKDMVIFQKIEIAGLEKTTACSYVLRPMKKIVFGQRWLEKMSLNN